MQKIIFIFLSVISIVSQGQNISIIPKPGIVKPGKGTFALSNATRIYIQDDGQKNTADFLNKYLHDYYDLHLQVVTEKPLRNYISLQTLRFIQPPANASHYTLVASPRSIEINGDSYAGTFYGVQSLIQLLPIEQNDSLELPAVSINDEARFPYRGMHLDVSRHFFEVDFIKKYIDYIALHKMNTFHWHLTDDQGWRIEIKKYPKLTSVGGFRNGTIIGRYPGKGNDSLHYGGFYTQDQIREVVKYAAERFVTVIPEIEMPGHSSAAIAAYPELSCFIDEDTKVPPRSTWSGSRNGKQVQQTWGIFDDIFCPSEFTFQFLQDVIDEVVELFPSTYIHIGGDEAPKSGWKRSPLAQQVIKENKLKDEHELQSYFIQRMEKYINSKGRKIIGWDEILEGGLAPNATVMSWRGEKGGITAASQNHEVIMTPQASVYLDHAQSKNEDSVTIGGFTPLEKIYNYEPVPADLNPGKEKYILGAQGNVWTEYMAYPSKVEYMIFPRMSALSEVLWSNKKQRNFPDFENRMDKQYERYKVWRSNSSNSYFDITTTVRPVKDGDGVELQYTSKTKKPGFTIAADSWSHLSIKDSITAIVTNSNTVYIQQSDKRNNQKIGNPQTITFSFNKATGKKISLHSTPSTTYAGNGGTFGLINGIKAKQFNSPEWFGFVGKDMDATIDLGKTQNISAIKVNCWDQEPSWVYLPKAIDVYVSSDSMKWIAFSDSLQNQTTSKTERTFTVLFNEKTAARYVRIVARNYGIIPEGKPGEGKNSLLFVDELEVE
jgi:hexosaminidase